MCETLALEQDFHDEINARSKELKITFIWI